MAFVINGYQFGYNTDVDPDSDVKSLHVSLVAQMMHLFGSGFVDDWMGRIFGLAIHYEAVDVEDSRDVDIAEVLTRVTISGAPVQEIIDTGGSVILYLDSADDSHFFTLVHRGGDYVLVDPYYEGFQEPGSHGFCQLFALMIATNNTAALTNDIMLNNWLAFQFGRSIIEICAAVDIARQSMERSLDPDLRVNDIDLFLQMIHLIDSAIFYNYCN